jgi:NADH-quinone oxidoreductase subunit L
MYMARVFILTFLGEPRDAEAQAHAHDAPATMSLPLVLLAVLTLVAGFVVFDQVGEAMGFPGGIADLIFLHEAHHFEFDWAVALGSTGLVAVGLAGAWYAWVLQPSLPRTAARALAPVHRALENKYYLDDIYQAVIDNVVLATSRLVAWFDRNVVNDTGVDGAAYTTGFVGYLLKFQQTGRLPNYALAIIVGVVALALVAFSLKT